MKKILVLGGTKNQVPLIKAAKEEGYYVVLCDWTTTNPGIQLADKHYQVSTLDREAVFQVALTERVDGVISNSEAAMENVAFISEKLGLVGNPVSAIEILISKDKFRVLQENVGIYAPKHVVVSSYEDFLNKVGEFSYPFIVKPVESSGSRGTTKIEGYNEDLLKKAFEENSEFSRNRKVSIEEYVSMPTLEVIDGDIFVNGDEIIWDGLFMSLRSPSAPMVPMTQVYPLQITEARKQVMKDSIRKVLKGAGIKHGVYNVEMYFTEANEPFIIEINARQGGNFISQTIKKHCGIDMCRLLVTTCVGDNSYYNDLKNRKIQHNYLTRLCVFSRKDGYFEDIFIADEIKDYVLDVQNMKKKGDCVEKCKNAASVVSYVNLVFDSEEKQNHYSYEIERYIYTILQGK